MELDLTDLRLFLHVHAVGTITEGAKRAHMTLASASERIRGMEYAVGCALLVRNRRGVEVTAAGRTLVHHARAVLHQMERLRQDLDQYSQGINGHIRLLCNTAAFNEYLPKALRTFLAIHPDISVDVEERPSPDVVIAVRSGLCDIGIVSDWVDLQGLVLHDFRADPLVIIAAQGHELAQHKSLGLADIADRDFVGLAPGSALQAHIGDHARRLGRQLNYRVRLDTFDGVCDMVALGIGIGIVPHAVTLRRPRASRLARIKLNDEWAKRRLVLCMRPTDTLPDFAHQLIAHIVGK